MKTIIIIALFAATAIALGYALISIPNVELITAVLFLSGMIIGWKNSIYVAVITYIIFSIFNPFGFPNPLLLTAQILGSFLAVFMGDISNRHDNLFFFILSGFLITLFYDVLTNLAGYIVFVSKQTLIAYLIGGLSFSLLHIISNILIFTLLLYPIRNKFKKMKRDL